jgi:hypothetical protein
MARFDWLLESVPLAFTPQRIQFLQGWTSDDSRDRTSGCFVPDRDVPRADVNAAMAVPPMTPPPPRAARSSSAFTMTAHAESVFHLPRVLVVPARAPSPPPSASTSAQLSSTMEDVAPASTAASAWEEPATSQQQQQQQPLSKGERELCVSTIRAWLTTHLQEMRKRIPASAGHLIDKLETAMIARLDQKTDVEIRDTAQLEHELQKDLNEEIGRLSTKRKSRAKQPPPGAAAAAVGATTQTTAPAAVANTPTAQSSSGASSSEKKKRTQQTAS